MDMLNLHEAWQFGRGAGVKVAVIDTGVTPHPRFPHLIPGGDYVMAGATGCPTATHTAPSWRR